jgi:hypothetical protein
MLSITNAAFKVYSSLPAIYSFVPSIGSINQKILFLFLILKSTVSSEMIGMFGVNSFILLQINSSTLKSPLLTGELSFFIVIFKPLENIYIDSFPARSNVSIKLSLMLFNSSCFIYYFF